MRITIFNRQFEHPPDGWYQIETPGEHPNAAAGCVQVIDDTAVASMVKTFNEESADYQRKTGRDYPGMLIDHEHFKNEPEKETTAYGWLMELQNRDGVPYGRINWTGTGKPAVDGGDYRFFSTEYNPADLEILNSGKPKRVRPMRLAGLTLTNDPNNKGGAPITNRLGYGPNGNTARPGPENFPTPDLDTWFAAVASILKSAGTHAKVALTWSCAWNLAKLQFPELYAAAFPDGESGADADDAATAAAADQVGALANRIRRTFGANFDQAWNFVRQQVPQVFNRMNPGRNLVLNRQSAGRNIPRQAAAVLRQMSTARRANSGLPLETEWLFVSRQNPALAKMARGQATLPESLAVQPELRVWFPVV